MKKNICSGENIADVPPSCCESSCITSSECNCHAISACRKRTAVWTHVGKGRTNRSTAVQATHARARDVLAF